MSKRINRILAIDINSKKEELLQKTANIVSTKGSVFFGSIKSINLDAMTITNRRFKDITLKITDINEIIIDSPA